MNNSANERRILPKIFNQNIKKTILSDSECYTDKYSNDKKNVKFDKFAQMYHKSNSRYASTKNSSINNPYYYSLKGHNFLKNQLLKYTINNKITPLIDKARYNELMDQNRNRTILYRKNTAHQAD